ncbi:hypothetical protein [uncultured Amphritea sp.]|uniref:hypothetical protein n=1 Tax=uncultured Amphritea sp. TaxID=981605 RepID=UPI0025F469FB|nr:hypothetical protein [uncultured Amphritea sp.]
MTLKKDDAIIRALDALTFDAGDWEPEHVERHLKEQIALAKKVLTQAGATESIAAIHGKLLDLQCLCNFVECGFDIHDRVVELINLTDEEEAR